MEKTKIYFILAIAYFMASCNRNLEDNKFLNPTAIVASTTVGLSTTTADFRQSNNPVFYSAKFNQPIYWQIKIKGLKSGGVKVFSGYGNIIDYKNSNWTGTSDSLFFFQAGEKCLVSFSTSGVVDTKLDTIYLASSRQFPSDRFLILNDFNDLSYSYEGNLQTYNGDTLDRSDPNNLIISKLKFINSDSVKIIEGSGVGIMSGDLLNYGNKYLIGGYYQTASAPIDFPNEGANADSIFINIIAKSDPSPYANKLSLQVTESDNQDPNKPGTDGDSWSFDTPELTTEWKVYSIRYSNLSVGYKPTGNGKREPNLLSKANINVIASTAGGKAKCYVDFYVVTYGKPFQP